MSFERYVITTTVTTIIKIMVNCITLKNFLPLNLISFHSHPQTAADLLSVSRIVYKWNFI